MRDVSALSSMTFIALMSNYWINQPCLQDHRIHNMLTLTYRALNGNTPVYFKNLLNERDTYYNLRDQQLLNVPRLILQTMLTLVSLLNL